jgi:hypothetical protein
MRFGYAKTFTKALTKLAHAEQKAVKMAAFDLQMDPSHPGLQFHRVDRSVDPDFWTARVTRDIRLVVHKRGEHFLLAYVGHHDDAYAWAERRRIEAHPTTGVAQIVEVRERVADTPTPPPPVAPAPEAPRLFADHDDDVFRACGVPEDWLADVRALSDEDALLALASRLPAEAGDALLNLHVGVAPTPPEVVAADPFDHPDAQRSFRLLEDSDELAAALEAPWDEWTVFLHPSQRDWVERDFAGPARVTGSAGTGKTVVALHRAVRMARAGDRVLLATFTETLADDLRIKLARLTGAGSPLLDRIAVRSMERLARELHQDALGPIRIASEAEIANALNAAKAAEGAPFTAQFLLDEWTHVVDAWDLRDADAYADVPRLGRKTRVGGKQREVLWRVMTDARARLEADGLTTWSAVFSVLTPRVAADPPFAAAVIDESQDLSVAELRFLAALAGGRGQLFFAGDVGQRIFRQPFSWRALGVDIRGRSRVLKVNYRTSQQIRARADRLLSTVIDGDGGEEDRRGIVSVFGGPSPDIAIVDDEAAEARLAADWLRDVTASEIAPREIGVIVRTQAQFARAEAACAAAGIAFERRISATAGDDAVTITTMPLAKGMEFRAALILACDEDIVPLSARLEGAATESELEEVYDTERHLLYVACTRARERLMVVGVAPASEFVSELNQDLPTSLPFMQIVKLLSSEA